MKLLKLKSLPELDGRPPLDRWLRFAAPIQRRYDEEHGAERVRDLRSAILVGLILYNVFNVTSTVTLSDALVLSVVMRLAIVTPVSLGIFWLVNRTTPAWTERIVTFGLFNAYLFPAFLFYWTADPDGLFTFVELLTIIVFTNMLIASRFHHAVLLTSGYFLVTVLVLVAKPNLSPPHFFILMVQLSALSIFTLYANYRLEWRRCRDYLATYDARLQAHSAMADRKIYEDASRTDALTLLPNRRHLDDCLQHWLSERRAIAVMMIDVDHFKLYNDTLGHPAGDECLRRIAAALATVADQAEEAICARFGGEEFTFAVSCLSEFEAARLARTLIQAVAALEIDHPARPDGIGIVTISIGVARCPGGTLVGVSDLVAAADRALYVAKRRGRNRFALDEEPSVIVQFAG